MPIKNKDKLRAVISRSMENCIGRDGGKLSSERQTLKSAYLGYGYGVDKERAELGLSTYVDRTVLETVEWAKPGIFRIFGNEEIIRFDPKNPEQEQAAEDATVYVNQVVFGRNMFTLVHDVLTDGLYQRAGWAIAHAHMKEQRVMSQYAGLLQEEALALIMDATGEVTDEATGEAGNGARWSGVGKVEDPERDIVVTSRNSALGTVYDLNIFRTEKKREIRIEPIPCEQVIISSDARSVENADFVAKWDIRTASDLRKEGFSAALIDELPVWDEELMPETQIAIRVNSEGDDDNGGYEEDAGRKYKIYDAWLDFDTNGDGIAEKIKVTFCGDSSPVIMKVEDWPLYRAPLFCACSVPLPHTAVGLGLADLVLDLQNLKTEITRQYLDGLAYSNSGELVIREGAGARVEYDSLLSRKPGAVHRVQGEVDITPLPLISASAEAMQGLEAASQVAERRTGISSRTQSVQADTLQNTATGASIMEEAVNQRLELIARVYAESFFKPLGRYVLHLVHNYQDKEVQIRLKGRFMSFDPRKWDPDMDISVAVGLGSGNRSKLVAVYQGIFQMQQQFVASLGKNSPVHLSNLIYTCHKMTEAAGLEAPERFFGTQEDAKQAEQAILNQPAPPSPEQQKLQLEQQKAQQQAQSDAQKMQLEAQKVQQQALADAQKLQLEAQEMHRQALTDAQKMQLEEQQARQQALTDEQKLRLEAQKMQQQAQADAQKMQLEEQKVQADAQIKAWEAKSKINLEQLKTQGNLALKSMEIQGEKELDQQKMRMGDNSPAVVNLNERSI